MQLAHVKYVLSEEVFTEHAGRDDLFLLSVNQTATYPMIMLTVAVVVLVAFVWGGKLKIVKRIHEALEKKCKEYEPLFPWMARLSLGIALIGAGSAGHLLSPALEAIPAVATAEILFGFMLLAGFLTNAAACMVLVLWLLAFFHGPYAFGSLEVAALALVLLVSRTEKPGIDDLLGFRASPHFERLTKYTPLILRVGLGFAFLFLGLYEKILNPHVAEEVVNLYNLTSIVHVKPAMWVLGAGLIEAAIGLALILGIRTRAVTAIAFCVLTASFFFFSEDVSSHVTIFGALSILFVTGSGPHALDAWIKKQVK